MKSTRYTYNALAKDLPALNERLKLAGHPLQFVIGARNGYTAIDLATDEQAARYCCQRMLTGGTPKECLNACYEYVVKNTQPIGVK